MPASASIGALGLADGSVLTAVSVHGIMIYASKFGAAFAAVKGDGSVVCWGHAVSGGDCAAVQEQLTDVKEIAGTGSAFAALKGDGSVVCWVDSFSGGDCAAVREQLID